MWTPAFQIPNAVVAVVGDVTGGLYSHSTINTLFMESGFPGDPPPGSCTVKSQAWIKRSHGDMSRRPLQALGELLGNFSIRRPPTRHEGAADWLRINTALAKAGLQFDGDSTVVPQSDSAERTQPAGVMTAVMPSLAEEKMLESQPSSSTQTYEVANQASAERTASRDVFLVHGHDLALKNGVARFLERLGLNPIILHEQPDNGDTVIEKLEAHAAPGFAVVLCTSDDVGRRAAESSMVLYPRPRQNVVLELGFFIGQIGRARVCAIVDQNIELPSDQDGILFAPRAEWQQKLLERLSSAGYKFDQLMITQALAIRC